jgi:hypothetical protein
MKVAGESWVWRRKDLGARGREAQRGCMEDPGKELNCPGLREARWWHGQIFLLFLTDNGGGSDKSLGSVLEP